MRRCFTRNPRRARPPGARRTARLPSATASGSPPTVSATRVPPWTGCGWAPGPGSPASATNSARLHALSARTAGTAGWSPSPSCSTAAAPAPAHLLGLALNATGVALTALGDLGAGVALAALALPLAAMLSSTAGTLLPRRAAVRDREPPHLAPCRHSAGSVPSPDLVPPHEARPRNRGRFRGRVARRGAP